MWIPLILYWVILTQIRSQLVGDNICPIQEKYTVTVEKHFQKPMTIREFVWCMSVPPRCSKYKTILKDEIKIEEEERTKQVNKCCAGFTEDDTQTQCIPVCTECIHGNCTDTEKCTCHIGYTGASCNQTCPDGSWGVSCGQQCNCSGAPCNALTGYCQCSGAKCDTSGYFSNISNTTKDCIFPNKKCLLKTKKTINKYSHKQLVPPEQNVTEINELILPTKQGLNVTNGDLSQMVIINKLKSPDIEELISDQKHETKLKKNSDGIGKIDRFSDDNTEPWLMDDIRIDNNKQYNINNPNRLLVISVIVTVAITCILILIAFLTIIIAKYNMYRSFIRDKQNAKDGNENRLSTQPIIQRSTFHAPLPDPPAFQSPNFSLISDEAGSCKIFYNRAYYNNVRENNEFNYDYPPSTGSYRAASIPDPEPLYDEIPGWRRPVPQNRSSIQLNENVNN